MLPNWQPHRPGLASYDVDVIYKLVDSYMVDLLFDRRHCGDPRILDAERPDAISASSEVN